MRTLRHHPGPQRRRFPAAAEDGERGVTVLVVSLAIVPLLIVAALVIDIGYAKQQRRQVQAAADAAALAAGQELDGSGDQIAKAIAAAKTWAAKNLPDLTSSSWVGCRDAQALEKTPDTANDNQCISFDKLDTPTSVRVRIPLQDEPQFFGMLAQSEPLRVDASALARRSVVPGASVGACGLCAWEWIQWSGKQNFEIVGGGTIHTKEITANWDTATSTIAPCPLKAVVNKSSNSKCPGTLTSPMTAVESPPEDPFAGVPDPPTNIVPCRDNNNQACNVNSANAATYLKPNRVFTQGVELSNITLALEPGNYYFAGAFRLKGNVRLTGTDVTLFFVCADSNQNSKPCSQGGGKGFIETEGAGNVVNIAAPTSGPYAGIAIYFDRNNGQGTAPKFQGTATSSYTFIGSIYAKEGKFTGTGLRTLDVTGQVYTRWFELNGETGPTIIRFSGAGSTSSGGYGQISLEG